MRLAFYAPLKAPGHPVPSGDRAIARLLLAALERAGAARGWEVDVASQFRSFDGAGDARRQARLRDLGVRVAGRLLRRYREDPDGRRPGLWFTYHLYHKAPDWIGPVVSERLGIPYVVAEASHAAKQRGGRWSLGHEAAAEAIRHADAVIALNRDDVAGVRQIARDPTRVIVLPPFLGPRGDAAHGSRLGPDPDPNPARAEGEDASGPSRRLPPPVTAGARAAPGRAGARAAVSRRCGVPDDEPWLLCVAMMRGGRKLASFEVLANALAGPDLAAARWHLLVAGEGPARRAVEAAFAARLPAGRITFLGRVEGEALAALHAGADLFVWPAVGEPMGMAMLEAQGHGLPVVSARTRGVPDLVLHEETGLLVPEGDAGAFADAVRALLGAPERRRRMGRAARDRVAREHGFTAASNRIGELVETLVRGHAARGEGERGGEAPLRSPSRPHARRRGGPARRDRTRRRDPAPVPPARSHRVERGGAHSGTAGHSARPRGAGSARDTAAPGSRRRAAPLVVEPAPSCPGRRRRPLARTRSRPSRGSPRWTGGMGREKPGLPPGRAGRGDAGERSARARLRDSRRGQPAPGPGPAPAVAPRDRGVRTPCRRRVPQGGGPRPARARHRLGHEGEGAGPAPVGTVPIDSKFPRGVSRGSRSPTSRSSSAARMVPDAVSGDRAVPRIRPSPGEGAVSPARPGDEDTIEKSAQDVDIRPTPGDLGPAAQGARFA